MAGGNIPGNLRGIFVAAGQQYHIPPQVLAGLTSVETNLGQNRGPSSAGAVGIAQFLPSTARSLGVNPYDDRSAIFGAAKYLTQLGYRSNPLRALGAYNGGPGNPQYSYANQVMSEANRLAGQLGGVQASGGLPAAPAKATAQGSSPGASAASQQASQQNNNFALLGNYLQQTPQNLWDTTKGQSSAINQQPLINFLSSAQSNLQNVAGNTPLMTHPAVSNAKAQANATGTPGASGSAKGLIPGNLHLGRTDQGVDFSGSGPIPAVIQGVVTRVVPRGGGSGWPGGAIVVIQGTGADAGKYTYLAENFDPHVRVGQRVNRGATLGSAIGVYPFIEYGWASNAQGNTLSAAHGTRDTHPHHSNTPEGIGFLHYLGY